MKTIRAYIFATTLFLALAGTSIWAQSTDVLIGTPEQNVLFTNIDNPLLVQANGVVGNNLVVTCKDAKTFQRQGVWYIHPQKSDSAEWITVKIFRKTAQGKNVSVGDKSFRVKNNPEQLACIETPNHIYRTGDRVPVTELTDSTTRIVPKYHDYMDYPESELKMDRFSVVCRQKHMRCTNDTLSCAARSAIIEALAESDEVKIIIHTPCIGKRTEKSFTQRVLPNSTFTIYNNRRKGASK